MVLDLHTMFVNSPRRDDFLMWCSIDGMSKNRPELKFFSTASNTQNDPPTVENVAVTVKKHSQLKKVVTPFSSTRSLTYLMSTTIYILYTLCCAVPTLLEKSSGAKLLLVASHRCPLTYHISSVNTIHFLCSACTTELSSGSRNYDNKYR